MKELALELLQKWYEKAEEEINRWDCSGNVYNKAMRELEAEFEEYKAKIEGENPQTFDSQTFKNGYVAYRNDFSCDVLDHPDWIKGWKQAQNDDHNGFYRYNLDQTPTGKTKENS